MIEPERYMDLVKSYFYFLISEFEFELVEEKARGNAFYEIRYKDNTRIVSISYENIEDYLSIMIFILQNGELPDYDDTTNSLHLNRVNAKILPNISKEEIISNSENFERFRSKNEFEHRLLKLARELRLSLTHFNFFLKIE